MEWIARKKRKAKFKQDTLDITKADAIRRATAHQKQIKNKQKKRERKAKAVQAIREQRMNELGYKCDNSTITSAASSVALSSLRKKRSASTNGSVKKRSSTKKLPPKTPEFNQLHQYLTPSLSSKSCSSIPSTVSTVNSSQPSISTQNSFMSSPPACSPPDTSAFSSVKKKKLPIMDPPLPVDTRFTDDNSTVPNSHKLPHDALCNPNEIRAAVFPGICYGCKHVFDECLEKKYHDLCLHSVKNLIDEYGYEGVTDFIARKTFHDKYTTWPILEEISKKQLVIMSLTICWTYPCVW